MTTTLQAAVSKTATFNGTGVDISGVDRNAWTLRVRVISFTGETARLEVQDSLDAFASEAKTLYVQDITGPVVAGAEQVFSLRWYERPTARVGVASATARVVLSAISGGTIQYEVLLES